MLNSVELFFSPALGTGIVRAFCTIFNLALLLAGLFFLRFFIMQYTKKYSPRHTAGGAHSWLVAIGTTILFCVLGIRSSMPPTEAASGDLRWLLLTLLDPVFSISTISSSPFPHFSGLNLTVRLFMVCAVIVAIHWLYRASKTWAKEFSEYLDQTPSTPEKRETTASENAKTMDGASEQRLPFKSVLNALLKLIPSAGGLAGLLGYIFGSEESRDAIVNILTGLKSLLDTITLTAQIDSNAAGAFPLLSNFLYVILSICILSIYCLILSILVIFVSTAWKKREKISGWVLQHAKQIWLCIGVVLLIVVAFVVVFVVGSGFGAMQGLFDTVFPPKETDMLELAAKFLLMALSICFAMLSLGFVIVFAIFVANFGYRTVQHSFSVLQNSQEKVFKIAKATTIVLVFLGFVSYFMLHYAAIRDELQAIFEVSDPLLRTPLWVLAHILLIPLAAFGILTLWLFALTFTRLVLSGMNRFIESKSSERFDERVMAFLRQATVRLIELFHLLPFALKHLYQAVSGLIGTLLRIFVGYRTESQKNRAIFVAACFASIASLLNTFFGLRDFYNDTSSWVPTVCSFAIASAVQLAMLIFGMKAGEGLAEKIMSNDSEIGRDYLKSIISRIFACIFYVLIYLTAAGIIIGGFLVKKEFTFRLEVVLPIFFLAVSTVYFIYGLILQIIQIKALRKAKHGLEKNRSEPSVIRRGTIKRISPPVYLAAYLLLMIVSTGFAFNNLFGYYAERAHLHERVFAQVQDQAKALLNSQVADLIQSYSRNLDTIWKELETREQRVTQMLENSSKRLDIAMMELQGDERQGRMDNLRGRYWGDTGDFNTIIAALKTYFNSEYDDLGNDLTLTIYDYAHYWGGTPQPSYHTGCLEIKGASNDDLSIVIGQKISPDNPKNIVNYSINGIQQSSTLSGRVVDPDSDVQSVAIASRTIEHADKYNLLEELLTMFETQENKILNYDIEGLIQEIMTGNKPNEHTNEKISDTIRPILRENAVLDDIRGSIAELYRSAARTPDARVSIVDIPRVMDHYLSYDYPNDIQGKNGAASIKETEYIKLDNFIEKALNINDILTTVAIVENKKDDEISGDTSAYVIRRGRSYAQGITYSNFQISYDTLLGGGLGLNPDHAINALYNAQATAWFMLLICFLVDMMAFFSGLLLFKNIFLFSQNAMLDRAGYLNYEAILTDLFAIDEDAQEPHHKLLQIALIYALLYGNPYEDEPYPPTPPAGAEKLYGILTSEEFLCRWQTTQITLEYLGITPEKLPDLRLWLFSFVREDEISFDELFEPL